jgi:predicted RNase H-like nuclease (RuvC/YqgF family)
LLSSHNAWTAFDLSLFASAAAAQVNASPERPNKERELQAQLVSKENEIRRLNERLASVCEQAAGAARLLCDLQQEKDRVQELMCEVQELQRQLLQQQDEAKTQNLQVMFCLTSKLKRRRQTITLSCSVMNSHALLPV